MTPKNNSTTPLPLLKPCCLCGNPAGLKTRRGSPPPDAKVLSVYVGCLSCPRHDVGITEKVPDYDDDGAYLKRWSQRLFESITYWNQLQDKTVRDYQASLNVGDSEAASDKSADDNDL